MIHHLIPLWSPAGATIKLHCDGCGRTFDTFVYVDDQADELRERARRFGWRRVYAHPGLDVCPACVFALRESGQPNDTPAPAAPSRRTAPIGSESPDLSKGGGEMCVACLRPRPRAMVVDGKARCHMAQPGQLDPEMVRAWRRWGEAQPRTAVCSHPCPIVCEQEHCGAETKASKAANGDM